MKQVKIRYKKLKRRVEVCTLSLKYWCAMNLAQSRLHSSNQCDKVVQLGETSETTTHLLVYLKSLMYYNRNPRSPQLSILSHILR